MFGPGKCGNRGIRDFRRASPEFRDAYGRHRRAYKLALRFGLAALVLCCWAGYAAAGDAPVTTKAPIKIAVFPFELEDFSAAGEQKPNPLEASYLAQSTEEARHELRQSGRYSLVDTAGAEIGTAKAQDLRNCAGCEASIARKLGADEALIGVVTKISMTEYAVQIQVRDVRKGAVISSFRTDLRIGANYSWFRGVRWLMQNRMLASK